MKKENIFQQFLNVFKTTEAMPNKNIKQVEENANDFKVLFRKRPQDFLEKGFSQYMNRVYDLAETTDISRLQQRFEALWGQKMPEDLATVIGFFSQAGYPKILDFQTHPPRTAGLDDPELNLVEEAILNGQKTFPVDNLVDWFTGTVCLDSLVYEGYQKANSFQYGLYDAQLTNLGRNQIYQFNYDTPDYHWGTRFNELKAKDLSSLLAVYLGAEAYKKHHLIDRQTFIETFANTKNRVNGNYNTFASLNLRDNQLRFYEMSCSGQKTPSFNFFSQSRWLIDLLRFSAEDARTYGKAQTKNFDLKDVKTVVPVALYALFATFFNQQDDKNTECIEVAKSSDSRIIRDAAALIAEFRNGRKELGVIKDIGLLRRK